MVIKMANMIPEHYVETESNGEYKIYEVLKEKLSNEWIVIHSFRWLKYNPIKGRKAQGEGDFVLFNPNYGVLVIEVKGGGILYNKGIWKSIDLYNIEHCIQDPERQANDTKYQIIDRIKGKGIRNCNVFHCVWFPDIREIKSEDLPPALSEEIVLTGKALYDPETTIDKVFDWWYKITRFKKVTISQKDNDRIKDILCKRMTKLRTLSSICEELNNLYVRANNEQIMLLDSLENFKKLSVSGRAGTGKTLLAIEKSKRDSYSGKTVLYLCYNNELAKRLRENMKDFENINIHTVHSYALTYLKRYHPARVIGIEDGIDFNYIMNEFEEVVDQKKELFDSVIIDEGQDFQQSWIENVKLLTSDNSNFYIFYDPFQELYSSVEKVDDSYLIVGGPYILYKNMRNTDEISKCLLNIIGQPVNINNFKGIHGKEPEFILFDDKKDYREILKDIIHDLTYIQLVNNKKITILTLTSLENSSFCQINLDIELTTVRKFKGLENDIIIIVDCDLSSVVDPVKKRLLYVAMSRARVHSIVLMKQSCRFKEYLLNKWRCSDEELEENIKEFVVKGDKTLCVI